MANVVCAPNRTVRVIRELVVLPIVLCGLSAAASAQTTVTLSTPGTQINADLTIQGGSAANTDFSSSDTLASKVSSASYTRRILLKFDTQNSIPAGANIQSAKLYLVLKSAESSENRPFTAYHVTQSFVSGQTNWNYFRSGQAWSRPGGDLGGTFGTTNVGAAVGSTYTFDVTALVQQSVNGEFGSRYTRLALIDTGAANSGNYREFHSTRSPNTSARPRLVITYGSGPTPIPTPPAPYSGETLRLMQFNIHKTKDSNGNCNPDLIATTIVAQRPDVVSLNEVNFYSGVCAWTFDMGEKIRGLLQSKTDGVTWYIRSANSNGVGNVLLSRIAPVSSSSHILSYGRAVAQMGIPVNGRTVNIFSTHVDYDNASARTTEIREALSWMNNFSEPRIVMGDFNTWPNTSDYWLVANVYQDSWVTAQNAGKATSYNGTGATHGTSRFDYAFASKVSSLTITSVNVPYTAVNGLWPSDHDPLVTVIAVR